MKTDPQNPQPGRAKCTHILGQKSLDTHSSHFFKTDWDTSLVVGGATNGALNLLLPYLTEQKLRACHHVGTQISGGYVVVGEATAKDTAHMARGGKGARVASSF